jgi:membrane protease YdiL (CAAX protease family)
MSRLARWISAHPVWAFFIVTYGLSWPLFLLVLVVLPQSMAVQGTLGVAAAFAPAFAAMIVAAVAEPQRLAKQRAAHWMTFLIAWIVAAASLVLFAWHVRNAPLNTALFIFGGVLALLPAFCVSRAFSRVTGVRKHFRSLIAPRGNVLWYVLALLVVPAVQLAGYGMSRLLGIEGGPEAELNLPFDPASAALLFLYGFFFAGGVNEESGWRGFALPRLQRKYCPLVAALIVWVFWALWHLPADLASDDPASSTLTNRLLFNAIWSILFAWVFNRTKGSLLAPAIFHPAMNASGMLLPKTDAAKVLFIMLTLVAIVSDRMWRRLPEEE